MAAQAYLEKHCNEYTGDFDRQPCGDWEPLGGAAGDLVAGPASDKGTGYVVATSTDHERQEDAVGLQPVVAVSSSRRMRMLPAQLP